MYNYVATAHRGTSVSHAGVGCFTSRDSKHPNFVVVKHSHLEIFTISADGLEGVMQVPLNGRVACMEFLKSPNPVEDRIALLTHDNDFVILGYDPAKGSILNLRNTSVKTEIGRLSETGSRMIMDPYNRMIALLIYDGLMKIIPLNSMGLTDEKKPSFSVRFEELSVLDIEFLDVGPSSDPVIAVLYQEPRDRSRHVKTYSVRSSVKDLKEGPFTYRNVDRSAVDLVPIPQPIGGVVVLGEAGILWINGSKEGGVDVVGTQKEGGLVQAVCRVDDRRLVLGDQYGGLWVLHLVATDDTNAPPLPRGGGRRMTTGLSLDVEFAGKTSAASCIVYLDNNVFYIGSHNGDSQLVRTHSEEFPREEQPHLTPLNSGYEEVIPPSWPNYLEILDTYDNLAPMLDFCLVDLDNQGQGQLVTCSGIYDDGSLRVIRNGIGITEHASLDLEGVTGMWSLGKNGAASESRTTLVISFISETRIMNVQEGALEEAESGYAGFVADRRTLFASDLGPDLWVQVAQDAAEGSSGASSGGWQAAAVIVVSKDSGRKVCSWAPEKSDGERITMACTSGDSLAVATSGGELCVLELVGEALQVTSRITTGKDVAAIGLWTSAKASGADSMDQEEGKVCLLAAGFWNDPTLRLYDAGAAEMAPQAHLALEADAIPRSLLLASFVAGDQLTLLAGLGDGKVAAASTDYSGEKLTDFKMVPLGTQPVSLFPFTSGGNSCVFAASDRPAVLHGSGRKLLFSNVNLKDISYVAPLSSEEYPDVLAFVSSKRDTLQLGGLDSIQKLHVRTSRIREMPRRITHLPEDDAFSVLTIRQARVSSSKKIVELNYVHLFDAQTLSLLDTYELELAKDEYGSSIAGVKLSGTQKPYVVVGTAYAPPTTDVPTGGRILVFQVVEGRRLHLIHAQHAEGAVFQLRELSSGHLLAAINARVQLFTWEAAGEDDGSAGELQPGPSRLVHILSLHMDSHNGFIAVGDLMKSVALLQHDEAAEKIKAIACDHNCAWMSALHMLDDDKIVGADADGNLVSFGRIVDARTEADRERLEILGEYRIGDAVHRFQEGSIVMQLPDATGEVQSRLVFVTLSGAVGILATLKKPDYDFLRRLESVLENVISRTGSLDHNKWRSFHNEHRTCLSHGFVDGDLIEQFLDLGPKTQLNVCQQLGGSTNVEDVRKKVEELCRLH